MRNAQTTKRLGQQLPRTSCQLAGRLVCAHVPEAVAEQVRPSTGEVIAGVSGGIRQIGQPTERRAQVSKWPDVAFRAGEAGRVCEDGGVG